METFAFSLPINFSEEGKRLFAVRSSEATSTVFKMTDENNSFSISTPSFWTHECGEDLNNKLNKLLEIISQNHFELRGKEVEKRGTRIQTENSGFSLAGFYLLKIEMLTKLKKVKYNYLADMVFRMNSTYDEIVDILDVKDIAGSTKGLTLLPGIKEITEKIFCCQSLYSPTR